MSFDRPFSGTTFFAAFATAVLVLLTPALMLPARGQAAESAQHAALSDGTKPEAPKSDAAKPNATTGTAPQPATAGPVAAVDPANPPQQKSLATRAIEKVKQVAKSANDIFSRVPCLPPKGSAQSMGSLPHVAGKLAAGQPVTIVAFGSSSTQGWGSSSPEFTYPNRLAAQLHRQYPGAEITVLNRGVGGEDAPEMMKRLQTAVIDAKPDLVIWQVGTNDALGHVELDKFKSCLKKTLAWLQEQHIDVILINPQYGDVLIKDAYYGEVVAAIADIARDSRVLLVDRFDAMRKLQRERGDQFYLSADNLHMNDEGYRCLAEQLAATIIGALPQGLGNVAAN